MAELDPSSGCKQFPAAEINGSLLSCGPRIVDEHCPGRLVEATMLANRAALYAVYPRKWAAYVGTRCVGVGRTIAEVDAHCMEKLSLAEDGFLVRRIEHPDRNDVQLVPPLSGDEQAQIETMSPDQVRNLARVGKWGIEGFVFGLRNRLNSAAPEGNQVA